MEKRERFEPALAFYMIIAWRVLFLTMLGRDCPQMPCDTVFADEEWKAAYLVTQRKPPPDEPPPRDTMVRMVAGLGGFLDRKTMASPDRRRCGSASNVPLISFWLWRLSAASGRVVGNGMGELEAA